MSIEELLEQFDEILDGGVKLPGKRTVVDVEKLRALIDDIRLNIPGEIKQARGIVADRTDIITNAKREADGIIRSAEERAKALVTQEEITRLAQEKASEIMKDLYSQVVTISTVAAVVTVSIALLLMNFSKSGRTVDESRAWLKRIIITWAIINGLGFIMAYVTPFFTGGTWTP